LGATVVELDGLVTRDDVPVVGHDHVAPSGKHVREMTYAEYDEECRQSGGRAVKWDQVGEWINDRAVLMLDLKTEYGDSKAVGVVVDWLNAHKELRVEVCEKNALALRQIGDGAPQVPLWRTLPQVDVRLGRIDKQVLQELWKQRKRNGWLEFGREVANAVRAVPDSRLARFRLMPFLGLEDELPALIEEVGAVGLTVEHSLTTKKLIQVARRLDIPVIAWVVNDAVHTRRLLKAGVSGITTDKVALVSQIANPKAQQAVHVPLVA